MEGLVIKSTGSSYWVLPDDGSDVLECKIKGTFRTKGIRTTNPVVVGDRVVVEEKDGILALITGICDRKNVIIRRASNLSKQGHILAANVDLAALIITIKLPETSTIFIDRFLAAAESYRVPSVLVFNKTDLYGEDDLLYLDALIALYENIGYKCFRISALNREGIEELKSELQGKITLLSGNSGVGKSTLLNVLQPDVEVKTGDISGYHNKGMHTTTFSEMLPLPEGGFIIDTPGIKGFGLLEVTPEEAGHYFREIFETSQNCKFYNCTHTHEPGCAVIAAVEALAINPSRYHSYLSIIEEITQGKYR
ncbi:ribosome small subunit-dependent GTPase A [Paludibacter jiangxiensis]|uniref:Small ribosomal subunit biogenesis GTPase RsgA n=1 Tax=Paludibacter jiangxiensis TaxID=681398 RepID=A0A161LIN0_9BACT|nr:ribosome small subunit-dependent GTPase A [Paludibacter jiangxiensis]GAT62286.1 ribosome biogenesis GTPase [Paludibacter jiangxiensis]